MRRIIAVMLSVFLIFGITGCSKAPQGKFVPPPESMTALIEEAQIVVKGTVEGDPEKLSYDGIDFLVTTVNVSEVLRGDEFVKDKTVRILQTDIDERADLKNDGVNILILHTYSGPITTDVFTIPSGKLGKFKLKNNKILSDYDEKSKVAVDIMSNNEYNNLIKLLKEHPFKEKSY